MKSLLQVPGYKRGKSGAARFLLGWGSGWSSQPQAPNTAINSHSLASSQDTDRKTVDWIASHFIQDVMSLSFFAFK